MQIFKNIKININTKNNNKVYKIMTIFNIHYHKTCNNNSNTNNKMMLC